VNVLAVVHGADCPPGSFGDVVEERGHRLDTWAIDSGSPPPRPVADYGAVIVLGGSMHADQEAEHPWLREEDEVIRGLLERRTPLLGVCLGAQLVAKAAEARVYALDEPEIGWVDVELASEAADDPVFAGLPRRFPAFQWHHYGFDVPAGGRELAHNNACTQAFRLGETVWAVQFHPEVTPAIVSSWADESPDPPPPTLCADTEEHINGWMRFGRSLCGAFLDAAQRVSLPS
jgi:GMP synthase-like glutamine amidotransferase